MDDTIPEFWVLYSRSRLVIVIIILFSWSSKFGLMFMK